MSKNFGILIIQGILKPNFLVVKRDALKDRDFVKKIYFAAMSGKALVVKK